MMIKKFVMITLPLLAGAVISAGAAGAAPMCKPANGPLGNLWPAVQSCQVPGVWGRYIRSAPPQNVPYPVNIPTPGFPFRVPLISPFITDPIR